MLKKTPKKAGRAPDAFLSPPSGGFGTPVRRLKTPPLHQFSLPPPPKNPPKIKNQRGSLANLETPGWSRFVGIVPLPGRCATRD